MFEFVSIKKEMGCQVSIWGFTDRTAQLLLISTCLDTSNADAAVESFRKSLDQLPFAAVKVELEKKQNTLRVDCRFRLRRLLRKRQIQNVFSSVLKVYHTHLSSLMRTRDEPRLGRLIWDGSLSRWTTDIALDGNTIPLCLRDWGNRDLSETIRDAIELIDNWDQWRTKIEEAQVRDLLNLYNDEWRRPESPPITATEVKARLSMSEIDCDDDGWRCVLYDQDELFTDHMIEMRISPDGVVEAVISG